MARVTAIKYLSNVAKSVKYASVDILKDLNPVIADTIETNADVAKVTYSTIKNFKQVSVRAAKTLSESQVGELAKTAKNNLLEDLKTGKFYNKEREEKVSNDFIDANFGEDISEFMVDDSEIDTSEDSMIDIVGEKTSKAISEVMVRTAEYQVEATRESTVRSLAQQAAMTATLHSDLSTINSNIAGLVEFSASSLTTHLENSKLFYETQQNQMNEQTSILKEILEIQKSVYIPTKRSASSKVTISDIFTSTGTINLANYFKYVQQNASENDSGIRDLIKMANDNGIFEQFAANPLGTITSSIVKATIPKILKESMQEFNESIAGSIATALINLTNKRGSGGIGGFLGNIFGLDLSVKNSLSTGSYNKEAVPWNGKDHKALTEVIPTLLSKIYSSISGNDEMRFDYESGKFKSLPQIKKDFERTKNRYISSANDTILPYINSQLSRVNFGADPKFKKQIIKDFEDIMKYNFNRSAYFNPRDKSISAKTYGLKGDDAEYRLQFIRKVYENIPIPKMLKSQQDLIDAIQSFNKNLQSYEESGDSIYNALFNDSTSSKNAKESPLFASSQKLDTTNNILTEILETIKSIKTTKNNYKGLRPNSGPQKAKKAKKNETIVSDEKESSEVKSDANTSYMSDLGIHVTTNDKTDFNYGDEIDEDTLKEISGDPSKTFIGGIKKAKTATQKIKAFFRGFNILAKQPVQFLGNVMRKVDTRLYDLLFGKKDGDTNTIMGKLSTKFDEWFDDLKTKTRQKLSDLWETLTQSGAAETVKGIVKNVFKIDIDQWLTEFKEAMFGDSNTSLVQGMKDVFKEGFSDMAKGVKKAFGFGKDALEENVIGVKNERGKAKESFNKTYDNIRNKLNAELKNRTKKQNADGTGETDPIDNAASGMRRVSKTGVIAVSEGEMIVPPDLNPYNIRQREQKEQSAIKKFRNAYKGFDKYIPSFATGGTVKDNSTMAKVARLIENGVDEDIIYEYILHNSKTDEELEQNIRNISKYRKQYNRDDYEKGKEPIYYKMGDEIKNIINDARENDIIDNIAKSVSANLSKAQTGKGKDAVKDIFANFKDYLPRFASGGIAGAGLSIMLGLAGGPLLGGAVGAGLGLLSKSNKLQEWLFGKKLVDADGKTSHDGSGVLSKDIVKNIDKYFPNMSKGAIVGGISSILPFVPGGPMAGILVGSAVGFAKSNDQLNAALFGEDKILGKMSKILKEKLPRMGLGAAAGFLAGPFGLTTNLILGSALGYVSDTEKFKDIVFGYRGSDGKRHGGLVKFIKDATEIPLNGIKKLFDSTLNWFKTDILSPFKKGLDPLLRQVSNFGNWMKNAIMDSVDTHIVRPIADKFLKVIRPVEKAMGWVLNNVILRPAKAIISSPFKLFGGIGDLFMGHQLKTVGGTRDMTLQQRMAAREARDHRKGRLRRKFNNFVQYDFFDTEKLNNRMRSRGSDAGRFDEYLNSMSDEDMMNLYRQQTMFGIHTGKKIKEDTLRRQTVARSGFDKLLTGDVGANKITRDESNTIMDWILKGDFKSARNYVENVGKYSDEERNNLRKKFIDLEESWNKDKEVYDKGYQHSKDLADSTGFKKITSRNYRDTVKRALQERGILGVDKDIKGEQKTPEEIHNEKIEVNSDAVRDSVKNIETDVHLQRLATEAMAYPNAGASKKILQEKNGTDEKPISAVTTVSDAITIAKETGNVSAAQNLLSGDLTNNPSKFRNFVRNISLKFKKKTKTVMTENGAILMKTDAQGNEIPDERDSETKETLQRQREDDNTQKGILAKISSIGAGLKNIFSSKGKDDDEKKGGLLSTLLGAGKTALGFLSSKGGLILGGLGLAALLGQKVNVKKRDQYGNIITGYDGEAVTEQVTIAEAIVQGGKRLWLGEDLTGNTNGVWHGIKSFATDTIIPGIKNIATYLLENLPSMIIKALPSLISGIFKGIGTGAKTAWDWLFGGKRGGDAVLYEEKDRYSVTGSNSATGNALLQNNAEGKSSINNDTINQKLLSDYKNNETTYDYDAKSKTFTAKGKNGTTTYNSTTGKSSSSSQSEEEKIVSEIIQSKAFNNITPVVQEQVLPQLIPIWNAKTATDEYVKDLLNNDTEILMYIDDAVTGETNIPVTGADILKYQPAAIMLGIDVCISEEQREAYSKELGHLQTNNALLSTGARVGRLALTKGKLGATGVRLTGKLFSKVFNGIGKIPGFKTASKILGTVATAPIKALDVTKTFIQNRQLGKTLSDSAKSSISEVSQAYSKDKKKRKEAKASKKTREKELKAKNKMNTSAKGASVGDDAVERLSGEVVDKSGNIISDVTEAGTELAEKGVKSNTVAKKMAGAADDAAEAAVKNKSLIDKTKKLLDDFFGDKKVVKAFTGAINKIKGGKNKITTEVTEGLLKKLSGTMIDNMAKKLASGVKGLATKISVKLGLGAATGGIVTVALLLVDFAFGVKNADAIMGVFKPTLLERAIAGIINAVCNNTPIGILFAPNEVLNWIISLLEGIGIDFSSLRERQAEVTAEVAAYNDQEDEALSEYDYLMKDKLETKIGNAVGNIWNSIFGKKDEEEKQAEIDVNAMTAEAEAKLSSLETNATGTSSNISSTIENPFKTTPEFTTKGASTIYDVPQEDVTVSALSSDGNIISSENQELMKTTVDDINNSIPKMAEAAKTNVANFFGLSSDQMNDSLAEMTSMYKNSGPKPLFDTLSNSWQKSTNAVNSFSSTLPDTVSSGYDSSGLSAINTGASGSGVDNRAAYDYDRSTEGFISQKYSEYANKPFRVKGDSPTTKVKDAGCAPAVATMAINSLGYSKKPLTMEDAMKDALEFKKPKGGVTADYFIDEFNNYGYNARFVAGTNNDKTAAVKSQLRKGSPVILMGKDSTNKSKNGSPFGPNYHYVVATGMSKDGNTIYINDPEAQRPNMPYSFSKIIKQSVLGVSPILKNGIRASQALIEKAKQALKRFSGMADKTIIYVGDSRIDSLKKTIKESDKVKFITRNNGNLEWIKNNSTLKNIRKVNTASGKDCIIIFCLGINDLGNASDYVKFYESKQLNPLKSEATIKYMAVNPVQPDKGSVPVTNERIEAFNAAIKEFAGDQFIDTYTYLQDDGFETSNGVKYDDETNKKIHQYVLDTLDGKVSESSSDLSNSSGGSTQEKEVNGVADLLNVFNELAAKWGLGGILDSGTTAATSRPYNPDSFKVDTKDINGNVSTNKEYAKQQKKIVAQMKSVEGKLKYAQGNERFPGSRNPDDGSGDCSSTVQWAYQKAIGVDVGSWTGAQETSDTTYQVADNVNNENKLQLADLILYRDSSGKSCHVEMYYGNGKMIGQSSGPPGPTIKNLYNESGSKKVSMVKRYVGFKDALDSYDNITGKKPLGQAALLSGSGSGLSFVSQLDSSYRNMKIGDETVGEAGCAPAVATMADTLLNKRSTVTMKNMVKSAANYKTPGSGVTADFFMDQFDKSGYNTTVISKKNIANALKAGPVVLLGTDSKNKSKSRSPFGPNSHYVLATGLSKDGKSMYINDPELKKPMLYKIKDILKGTKLAIRPISKKAKIPEFVLRKARKTLSKISGKDTNMSIVFVGDSRTNGLKNAIGSVNNVKFIAKDSSGFSYCSGSAKSGLDKIVKDNPGINIVFNFGVNDLGNIDKYIEFYKNLKYEGCTIWHMSVNPVVDGKSNATNAQIEEFNAKYKNFAGSNYIDTYSYLTANDFKTTDGLHYDKDTYKKIYDYCISVIGGNANASQSSNSGNSSGDNFSNSSENGDSPFQDLLNAFDNLINAYGLGQSVTEAIEESSEGTNSGDTVEGVYSGSNGEEQTWSYLKNKGIPEKGIAGLMGNIRHESGFKFNNVEDLLEQRLREAGQNYNDETYTAAVDNGTIDKNTFLHPRGGDTQYGYGLVQWTSPGRKEGLYNLVKSRNVSISNPGAQLDWLWQELNSSSYAPTLNAMKSGTSVRGVSDVVLDNFEVPADRGESVRQTRANSGQEYYDKYHGKNFTFDEEETEEDDNEKSKKSKSKSGKGSGLLNNYSGKGSSVSTGTTTRQTPSYKYTSISQNSTGSYGVSTPNVVINQKDKSTSTTDKILEVLVGLLSQVVSNTASIKDIVSVLSKLVDAKSENTTDLETRKELLNTKVMMLRSMQENMKSNDTQTLEKLIRNVEAIAQQ